LDKIPPHQFTINIYPNNYYSTSNLSNKENLKD